MTRDMKVPVKVVIIMAKLVTYSNIDEKNDIPRQNNGHHSAIIYIMKKSRLCT